MTIRQQTNTPMKTTARPDETPNGHDPLNTVFFEGCGQQPVQRHASPQAAFTRWLSVEQIRKMQRMRRNTVIKAMNAGDLPFEQRGRIRYARLSDVLLWEERRLRHAASPSRHVIDPDLLDLAG